MNNRAFEFLDMALSALQTRKVDRELVETYIRLAVTEVQELVESTTDAEINDDVKLLRVINGGYSLVDGRQCARIAR